MVHIHFLCNHQAADSVCRRNKGRHGQQVCCGSHRLAGHRSLRLRHALCRNGKRPDRSWAFGPPFFFSFDCCLLPYRLLLIVSFSSGRISDFGGNPSRAARRVASCFGMPELFRASQKTTCYVRLNMNLPKVKLCCAVQPDFSGKTHLPSFHYLVGGKVTAIYLAIKQRVVCNGMTSGVIYRHGL